MRAKLNSPSWEIYLKDEFSKPYMLALEDFLETEKKEGKEVLPSEEKFFRALELTELDEVKVVILGQDPYPTKGHANGLCFSVESTVDPLPKSLQNINKELWSDCHIDNTHTGDLTSWAQQGVLLLNAVLSVQEGKANAHKDRGWEQFTDKVIELVDTHAEGVVFVLWGAYAQKKGAFIDTTKHFVLKDPHPSPLSAYRGFWGSKPFSKINAYLAQHGKIPIKWAL